MTRIISFLVVSIAAATLPWWGWLVVLIPYCWWYQGIETIVIGLAFDAYLGTRSGIPVYTLVAGGVSLGLLLIRPYLNLPKQND